MALQAIVDESRIDPPTARIDTVGPVLLVTVGESTVEVFELGDGTLTDGNSVVVDARAESDRDRLVRERFGSSASDVGGTTLRPLILKAPMPGLIRSLLVKEGDVVARNAPVIVLEAMKMENNILAPGPFKVSRIFVTENASVDKNASLIEFGPPD